LDGGCLYQHFALLAAARMVGVGEFEQFDGRAVLRLRGQVPVINRHNRISVARHCADREFAKGK
jgi:hypothetical protein